MLIKTILIHLTHLLLFVSDYLKHAAVDLRIYNILGQEVAVLINGQNLSAGTYNYSFDASKLSSGTYIYRLQSGNNVVSKKMMLVK